MSICQLCTGWGGHHDPVAHGEVEDDVRSDLELMAQGFCPRTGRLMAPYGNIRPACQVCDCGEEEP